MFMIAPAVVWTVAFFVLPTLSILLLGFFEKGPGGVLVPSPGNYQRFLEQDYFVRSLWNSVLLTAMVTVISIGLAYPLAAMIAFRVPPRWQRLCLILAVLPFWTSYVVRSYAWLLVLAPNGVINQTLMALGLIEAPLTLSFTFGASVVGFAHFFTMLCTLTIYASLTRIDPKWIAAARDLGASSAQVFWRVLLPLSVPGIAAGAFLTIVVCIGDYVTPQILGGNTSLVLPQTIIAQIQRRGDVPMAAMLSTVMMIAIAIVYLGLARRLRMARS